MSKDDIYIEEIARRDNDLRKLEIYLDKVSFILAMMGQGMLVIEDQKLNKCYIEILNEIDIILKRDDFAGLLELKPDLPDGLLGHSIAGVTYMDDINEMLVPAIGQYRNKVSQMIIETERELREVIGEKEYEELRAQINKILGRDESFSDKDATHEAIILKPQEKRLLESVDACLDEYKSNYKEKVATMSPEDSVKRELIRFLKLKTDELVNTTAKFEVWKAEIETRLRLHLDPDKNTLFEKFIEITAGPHVEDVHGPLLDANDMPPPSDALIFSPENVKKAKEVVEAICVFIEDVGLSRNEDSAISKDANSQYDKSHNQTNINIQQTQSQNQNTNITSLLKLELSDDQFSELKQILEEKNKTERSQRLSDFFKSIGVELMAKVLTSFILT